RADRPARHPERAGAALPWRPAAGLPDPPGPGIGLRRRLPVEGRKHNAGPGAGVVLDQTRGERLEAVLRRGGDAARRTVGDRTVGLEDVVVLLVGQVVGVELRREVLGDLVARHQVDQGVGVLLDLLALAGGVYCIGVHGVLPVHAAADGQLVTEDARHPVGGEGAQQLGRIDGVGLVAVLFLYAELGVAGAQVPA